jgi:MarR family transcriptional regulator for hemolysin
MAESIGIQGATVTHHLNAMEADGLVTRRRDPTNRRVHVVELTEAGEALFLQLRNAAVAFDRQLRAGVNEGDVASFTRVLDRLHANVASPDER